VGDVLDARDPDIDSVRPASKVNECAPILVYRAPASLCPLGEALRICASWWCRKAGSSEPCRQQIIVLAVEDKTLGRLEIRTAGVGSVRRESRCSKE
jgi:hypothetical protein